MNNRFTRRAAMQAIGATASLLPLSAQQLNAPPVLPGPAGGPTTSTVEDLTGKKPRSLRDWLTENISVFRN